MRETIWSLSRSSCRARVHASTPPTISDARSSAPAAAAQKTSGSTVAREPAELSWLAGRRIAIPGAYTTAHLLLRCFAPRAITVVPMRFDRIMPAVARGEADAGLVIHEARFVFQDHGLVQVAVLGEVWEAATGLPLPLGVIAAHRELPERQAFRERRHQRTTPVRGGSAAARSAITVSPAMAPWPGQTRGATPSGR